MEAITRMSVYPIYSLKQVTSNKWLGVMRDKTHNFKRIRLEIKYKLHAKDELQKLP
jgi:hypothetical protein